MPPDRTLGRRTFLKGTGTVAGTAALSGIAAAGDGTVDDALDADGGLQEAIVVFQSRDDVSRLGSLDLAAGHYEFEALPFGYAKLTGEQISEVAAWPDVTHVQGNPELEFHNDDARDVTGVEAVQEELFYTGESVHAVVIDSGVDGDHPDFEHNLQHNYRFQNPLEGEMWHDVGPVDTASQGHGTHVSGAVAGGGQSSDGQYRGMAPDADLTVYSTDAAISLLNIVGAYDDVVDRQRSGKHDVQVINNSYGGSLGGDYNPTGALQRATWEAYQLGMLSVFSAGNSGPGTNTMGDYAAGPHVMSSAATNDDAEVTEFSSRGRTPDYDEPGDGPNYDRKQALEQLRTYYDRGFISEDRRIDDYPETRTGTMGVAGTGLVPYVSPPEPPDTPVTGPVYEEFTTDAKAKFIQATFGWTPDGADNDIYLRKGATDGPVVGSSTGFVNANPETIRARVEPNTTYYFELKPFANVVCQYELTFSLYELGDTTVPERPYGVHRPAVGTPGDFTMSTLSPDDPHQTYAAQAQAVDPATESAQNPYYGALSGTSMSAPGLTGIAALVYDAYRQNHGEFPDPIEVINTLEATAANLHDSYTTYNIGAGFVRANRAVERAEAGTLAGFDEVDLVGTDPEGGSNPDAFEITAGSRADDGTVFTAGQTNRVRLTIEASTAARVRDRIPFDWEVVGGDHDDLVTENGTRYVVFETVDAAADGGTTVSYFVRAPESTGEYTFGAAEARGVDGTDFQRFTGTDTNRVLGVDQNDAPL